MAIKFKFGKWPKRSQRSTDRLAHALDLLIRGIHRQLSFLNIDIDPKDRSHWYRVVEGIYYCRLYVSNIAVVLNDETAEETFTASSAKEAKNLYEQLLQDVEAGQYNERIKKHLAAIPPRKPRGSAGSE